jgi:hypothetical protein
VIFFLAYASRWRISEGVMKTKHTAKVIGKTGSGQPIRTYRGHLIVKLNNAYLCDPELTGSEYHVYDKDQSPQYHSAIEIVTTLAEAKWYVDCLNR